MRKLIEKSDKILKYLFAAILIAVPLYPKFPLISIPGTYVAVRLEDILLLLTSVFLFFYFFKRYKNIIKEPIFIAICLFLGIGALSLFSSFFVTKTISLHLGILHWARRIEYLAPFFLGLALTYESKEKPVDFIIKILLITMFGALIYGIGQKVFSWPAIITQNNEYSKGIALRQVPGGHLNSTFAGHYDLATFLVLLLPIVVSSIALLKGKFTRLTLIVVFLGGVWLLANTLSRISIVSYLGAIAISLLILRKYKLLVTCVFTSILIFAFSTSLLDRYFKIIDVARENMIRKILLVPSAAYAQDSAIPERRKDTQIKPIYEPILEDRSTSIRINVEWPRAIRAFNKNPILGTGYSSITLATDNDYLRLLGETGLLGVATFTLILLYTLYYLYRSLRAISSFSGASQALIVGFTGGFAGVLLNAFFIDVFEASKFAIIFWLFAGLVIGQAFCLRNAQNRIK